MKIKMLLGIIAPSLLIMASCNNNDSSINNSSNISSSIISSSSIYELSASSSNVNDNELSLKAYEEYSKTFIDITYKEFLSNVKIFKDYGTRYSINNFEIYFNLNNELYKKIIYSKDSSGNLVYKYLYNYSSDIIIEKIKCKYLNNKECPEYDYIYDNDGNLTKKEEYSYDESNKIIKCILSIYKNNKILKITHFNYIDDEKRYISLEIDYDNYIKIEYIVNNDNVSLPLIIYHLINDEWVMTSKYKYINDKELVEYEIIFTTDDKFDSKIEREFDEYGNLILEKIYKYNNGKWELK